MWRLRFRKIVDKYGVVVVRNTGLTDAAHVEFSKYFGQLDDVTPYNKAGRKHRLLFLELFDAGNIDPNTDDVGAMTNTTIVNNLANQMFHVDSSFNARRAGHSLLLTHILPPKGTGGSTEYCDSRTAYDDLPEDLKKRLEGVVGYHSLFHSRKVFAEHQEIDDDCWLFSHCIYLAPILGSVGVTDSVKITAVNGGLNIWNTICAFSGAFFAFRVGRRPLLLVATAGMLFAYVLITGLSAGYVETKKSSIGVAVVPMLFLYEMFHQSGWTPMPYGYVSEILPYGLRTKGLAIAVLSNQTGNGVNQLINPIALAAIGWKYYPLYIALLILFFFIIYFFFPETKGLTLEEISYVFDHGGVKGATEAAVAHASAAARALDVKAPGHKAGDEIDVTDKAEEVRRETA